MVAFLFTLRFKASKEYMYAFLLRKVRLKKRVFLK